MLCYHNVVADILEGRAGDSSLHMGVTRFRDHLDWLSRSFDVVPAAELVSRVQRGASIAGLAAITFDDGYLGVLRHAVPLLVARSLPATVFIVTGAAAAPRAYWWDVLASAGILDERTRLICRDDLRGDGDRIRESYPAEPRALDADLVAGDYSQLGAASHGLLDWGSHTVTHRNLARLTVEETVSELVGSRESIEQHLATRPALVSYPYGCTSPEVESSARASGYSGGIALSFGRILPESNPFGVVRINVPSGLPVEALDCWTAGFRWRPFR